MAAGDLLNTIGDGGAELGLADLFPASNAAFSSSRSNSVIHQSSPNHLAELLEKAGEGDFLRAVAEAVLQLLMESDVEGPIGTGRYERSGERTTWRNGYRDRTLDTRLGALRLRIPKLRQGSYFPPFLEARKSSEKALIAVIQEAWIGGVSTRRVDDLVQAMGLSGISKSQVSKLCKSLPPRTPGRSTSGSMPSSTGHSPANGRIWAIMGGSCAGTPAGFRPPFGQLEAPG
jgi:hypothetical protein